MGGRTVTVELENGIALRVSFERLGRDLSVTVTGGDRPHIGSVAVAVPRPSLTGNGTLSATVSVMNMTGHKDDAVSVPLAKALAAHFNGTVCVSAGIHFDAVTERETEAVIGAVPLILARICAEAEKDNAD